MAKFNPDVAQVQDPNYLNQSKGVDAPKPNKSFETLFEGLGGVGDGIVKTIDSSNKADIQNQVVAGVDAIRGATGVDVATDRAAQGNTLVPNQAGSPVPSAITKASGEVSRLKDAYDQGKINDSYYWGRVNALAKSIRTQYPGYREEIDSSFSGVTGANPANALRKAIQSDFDAAQGKLDQAQSKEDSFVVQKADIIGQVAPDYYQRKAAGNPYSFDEVKQRVMRRETINQVRSQDSAEMDFESKKGTLTADRAQGSATSSANDIVNQSVAAGVQSLGAKIQESLKSGKPIPPEQIAEFQAAYGQLRAKAEVSVNQMLNKPFGDDPTKTYASTIKDSSKLKGIKDNALANLDSMKELLTNGQYGVFQMNASIAKASTDYAQATILQKSDAARKMAAAQAISPVALNSVVLNRPEILGEFVEAITNVHIAESVTGEGSITKQLDQLKDPKQSNKIGRGGAVRLIDDKVNMIKSKDASDTEKVNVAKSVFSDQEAGFLEKFSSGDRLRVFQKLTAPEVTKEMQTLRSSDPKTYENYRKWATNSFSTLLKTQANTIQDINAYNEDVKLSFDPASMQYNITIADAKPNTNLPVTGQVIVGTAQALGNKLRMNEAQQALGPINAALKNLAPIINEGNKDPEALVKVLTGIDPQGAKQTGLLQWLGNGALNAISGAADAVGKAVVSPAKGATNKSNPKADLQLASYTEQDNKGAINDSVFEAADLGGVTLDGGSDVGASGPTKSLLDTISKGESGGSYNKIFGGREVPLTDMTIQEVMSLQNRMVKSGAGSSAVGKYQFINKTLGNAVRAAGLPPDTQFTPEVQDKLATILLKGRGLDRYLKGSLSEDAFIDNLSQEWAALPNSKGRGHYDGDGLNKANTKLGTIREAVRSLKS